MSMTSIIIREVHLVASKKYFSCSLDARFLNMFRMNNCEFTFFVSAIIFPMISTVCINTRTFKYMESIEFFQSRLSRMRLLAVFFVVLFVGSAFAGYEANPGRHRRIYGAPRSAPPSRPHHGSDPYGYGGGPWHTPKSYPTPPTKGHHPF